MTIDTSKLTINFLYQWNPDLFVIVQKKASRFFYRDVTVLPITFSCIPSRIITKNAKTQPHSMRDVITEQPIES